MSYFSGIHLLLVLLPGFLAAWIVSSLTIGQTRSEFDKVIEALVYSFIVYAICVVIFGFTDLGAFLAQDNFSDSLIQQAKWPILTSLILSVALGLALSWSITNDKITNGLRALGITARSSRASVWSDVFHTVDGYVLIEFDDGRRLMGWPQHFSDTPEDGSLFLTRAAWIEEDNARVEIEGPGILVTKNLPIQTIMFLNGITNEEPENRDA
jgi:hypothetical protein